MSAVSMLWGPGADRAPTIVATAVGGQSLNDSDNSVAAIFCAPKTGTINKVGFYIISENGSSPAYKVGLVTVDSSGNPTTTAYGGSAIETPAFTAAGWVWVTLTTPASATVGDFFALRIWPHTTAPDGTNYIRVAYETVDSVGHIATWVWLASAASYPGGGLFAVQYDDGAIYGNALSNNTLSVTINAGTTPDEVGALFTVPFAMTVAGLAFVTNNIYVGVAATFVVTLYAADNTVLAATTVSDRDFISQSGRRRVVIPFAPVSLQPNTNYRITIAATTSTNGNVPIAQWECESATAKLVYTEAARWQKTERTNSGAWTDTATALPAMALLVTDLTSTPNTEYAYCS